MAVIFLSQRNGIKCCKIRRFYSNQKSTNITCQKSKTWSSQLPQSFPLSLSFPKLQLLVSCVVRLIDIFYKYNIGANQHIFSRRRARCTSMLTHAQLCSLTQPLFIILKDLKCESCLLDWSWQSYWKKYLGPEGLTCCGPLVDAVGKWVNLSAKSDHTQQILIYFNVMKLRPWNSWCLQGPN